MNNRSSAFTPKWVDGDDFAVTQQGEFLAEGDFFSFVRATVQGQNGLLNLMEQLLKLAAQHGVQERVRYRLMARVPFDNEVALIYAVEHPDPVQVPDQRDRLHSIDYFLPDTPKQMAREKSMRDFVDQMLAKHDPFRRQAF